MRASLAAALFAILAWPASAQDQQAVKFPSVDGDMTGGAPTVLEGLLEKPAGAGPFPAVVLAHGCGGVRSSSGARYARDEDWAARLRDAGYAVLRVDSFGPRGVRELCSSKERKIEPGRERARDAYGALLYLQSLPFVVADRVGLMGWSHGGMTALWTILDPITARPKALPKGDFAAAVAFYPSCRGAMEYKPGWKTTIPFLMLSGEKDDWTPAQPCQALAEKAKGRGDPVEFVLYPDSYHQFDAPNQPLTVIRNVASTESGTATLGTNAQARADALERVPAFLAKHLKR